MAQVVLKCSSNQNESGYGILDNTLVEDNLVDLSMKFGEFCNSLASKGLFATGYANDSMDYGIVPNNYSHNIITNGSVHYGGLVHRSVFSTYAPRWLEYARREFIGYFSTATFTKFENVINHINNSRDSSASILSASEGIRVWDLINQEWDEVNAGSDNSYANHRRLAAGWRGGTWFDLFPLRKLTPLIGLERKYGSGSPSTDRNIYDIEFLNADLNSFYIGMSRGYSAGFVDKLAASYAYKRDTESVDNGD